MIELILGVLVLIGTLGFAFLDVMAAAMSDSPGASAPIPLSLVLGVGGAIEVGLFLLWFAKTKGWN